MLPTEAGTEESLLNLLIKSERKSRDLIDEFIKFGAFASEYLAGKKNADDENDEEDDPAEEKTDDNVGESKKRRTAKMEGKQLPVTWESEQIKDRAERQLIRAKRRAMKSSLVEELRAEMEEAPEQLLDRHGIMATRKREEARRRYEESNFIRLSQGKRKRRQEGNELDQLLSFGRYKLPVADEEQAGGIARRTTDNKQQRKGRGFGGQGNLEERSRRKRHSFGTQSRGKWKKPMSTKKKRPHL